MGLWWKRVDAVPPRVGCADFSGDRDAILKQWPILWRFQHNWALLEVKQIFGAADYHVYFESKDVVMQCRRRFRARYLFVRIGPDPVRFWATSVDGASIYLYFTRKWLLSSLRSNARSNGRITLREVRHNSQLGEIPFI